jgi:LmbE family N-acetylglucosaminyl deacetylase
MKYLFIFAHPDDETIACAGTIKKLIEAGDQVTVVSVTDGGAGEVKPEAQAILKELGSVSALRRYEFAQVTQFLGLEQTKILDFQDGQITNEMVWGKLKQRIIDLIDEIQPEVVITFDHSGWYFHLDHVGTSIATTLAVQEAAYPPEVFFLSLFKMNRTKWNYVYPEKLPFTHVVDFSDMVEMKLQAIDLHVSQTLQEPRRRIVEDKEYQELFQLAWCTDKGKKILAEQNIFSLKPASS